MFLFVNNFAASAGSPPDVASFKALKLVALSRFIFASLILSNVVTIFWFGVIWSAFFITSCKVLSSRVLLPRAKDLPSAFTLFQSSPNKSFA